MSRIKFISNKPVTDPFNAIFNDFFEGEFSSRKAHGFRNASVPAANIKEADRAFHVELAAPGREKEDFKIEVDENLLTIRTEQKEEKSEDNERFTKREFNYSAFTRSFRLPEDVKQDEISASYENGILKLEIPKMEEEKKNKSRAIAVK